MSGLYNISHKGFDVCHYGGAGTYLALSGVHSVRAGSSRALPADAQSRPACPRPRHAGRRPGGRRRDRSEHRRANRPGGRHQPLQQAGCTSDTTDPAWLALLTWSALHGQATLRIDRPHGPWPPLEETVPDLMTRLLRLRGKTGPPEEPGLSG